MRAVIFSDSHTNYRILKDIVNNQDKADYYIHLGDGASEVEKLREEFKDKKFYNVKGNCDFASQVPITDMIKINGIKILFTHGHAFNVKWDLQLLKEHAHGIGADIVLFGHTHIALNEYENGIYYLNPGSVSLPKAKTASYGIVDITEQGIFTNIVYS